MHCSKLSSRSPFTLRCEHFHRWDRGIHKEEASVAYYSSNHLKGVARPLLPILLPLHPPHGTTKDYGLQNRHLPAPAMLKLEPLLNHPGVLPSMNPLPRSRHMWCLPPNQYQHGSLILSWMACLTLLMLVFGYRRREKGVALLKA